MGCDVYTIQLFLKKTILIILTAHTPRVNRYIIFVLLSLILKTQFYSNEPLALLHVFTVLINDNWVVNGSFFYIFNKHENIFDEK